MLHFIKNQIIKGIYRKFVHTKMEYSDKISYIKLLKLNVKQQQP